MVTLIDRLLLQPVASLGMVLYIEWLTFPLFRIYLSLSVRTPSNIPNHQLEILLHVYSDRHISSACLELSSYSPGQSLSFLLFHLLHLVLTYVFLQLQPNTVVCGKVVHIILHMGTFQYLHGNCCYKRNLPKVGIVPMYLTSLSHTSLANLPRF
ncbi:hypothetical protein YC2023_108041 [Brassica napus]